MNEALVIDECGTPRAALANTASFHRRDEIDIHRTTPGERQRGLVTLCTGRGLPPTITIERI